MKNPLFATLLCISLLSFLGSTQTAKASVPDEALTITLEKPVYFFGTDGSPVIAQAGQYTVEATQEWFRLTPGTEPRDALMVETSTGAHEEEVYEPIAISVPGDEDSPDTHVVSLLLPDGESIEAVGTYSGIHGRNIFSSIYNYGKRTYNKQKRKYATK